MKKVILIVTAVIGVIVAGMFLYISFMDWNSHKDKIAGQFSNVTGKDVVFEGPVDFKVFPSPYLSASNIKIYDNNRQANPNPLAVIKNMQVDFSFWSLFSGQFDVKRMVIKDPEVTLEVLSEGKINWQSPLTYDQTSEKIDVILDSVTIENAKINIISQQDNINISLDNLNAEVVGESIFGPYRIEGTYVKDNNPEGFALSLGQFSDIAPTTLNFVVTHPKSSTHLRFDGSFFLKNSAVNGSVVFESEKVVDFLNSYFQYNISQDFEHPVAVSMELNTNKTKLDISNFVIKYGETVGAGNVLLPLQDKEVDYSDKVEKNRKKVEVSFNMTDLDLTPFVKALELAKNHYDKDKQKFSVDLGYDILFDLKSVKTNYREHNIRDFSISLDVLEDTVVINSIGAIFPGETSFTSKGRVFALEDILTYNMDFAINSVDALKMFQWLGYNIPTVNQFTYRGLEVTTNVSGNLKNIKLSPFNLKLDKSIVEGELGISRAERTNLFVDLSIDSINFDNYLEKLPANVLGKSLDAKMNYFFSKIGFLNDVDMQFDTTLNLGIYSSIPFENTNLSFVLKDGSMDVNNLSIASVRNASLNLKGELSGFGEIVKFSNMKYGLNTQDFYSIFSEDSLPPLLREAKDLKKIDLKGVVTGDFNYFATKSVIKLDNIDLAYSGNIHLNEDAKNIDGKIELRAPDFIKFINRFNLKYNPRVLSMGVFRIKSGIKGYYNDFSLKDMEAYIGSNKFSGDLVYKKSGGKPDIVANLHINRFELDRFFYNDNKGADSQPGVFALQNTTAVEFIAKPYLDKIKIDYAPYAKARIKGDFLVDALAYKNEQINQAKFKIDINDTSINLSEFSGDYSGSDLTGSFAINLSGDNIASGKIALNKKPIERLFLGSKYGFEGGMLGVSSDFNSVASSQNDFFTNLSGIINFNVKDTTFVGWNIGVIEQDLENRSVVEGLSSLVLKNIQSGKTKFASFGGSINLDKGKYKFLNSVFASDKYDVNIVLAEGSIDLWDIKSEFVLNLDEVANLPNVKFAYNGPLSAPAATVDVAAIGSTYQQRIDAIEADKQRKELERLDKLSFLMGEEQDKAEVVEKTLIKKIDFVNEIMSKTKNSNIANEYKSILNLLNNIKDNIDMVLATIGKDESTYTNKAIEEAKVYNDNAEKELVNIQKRIDETHLKDVKDLADRKYGEIAGKYSQSRENILKYRDKFVSYPTRMAVIQKISVINNDKKIQELKDQIEELFLKLDAQNNEASKDYNNIQVINNVAELQGYIAKAEDVITVYDAEELSLEKSIDELMIYLEKLVSQEEKEYDRSVEEELKKQKIEENKGSILNSSGKSTVVVRDLEEIAKSEEIKQGEEIKVLDFSKDDTSSTKVTTEKKTITREEINSAVSKVSGGNILKKIDGESLGASGSVSKK